MRTAAVIKIESEYHHIARAWNEVEAVFDAHLTDDKMNELKIGVNEALNNVIEHSYTETPGHEIEITCSHAGTHVMVQITDFGLGMDEQKFAARPTEIVVDDIDTDSLPEGGMGIALIKSCMDETHYSRKDGANVLQLVKNL